MTPQHNGEPIRYNVQMLDNLPKGRDKRFAFSGFRLLAVHGSQPAFHRPAHLQVEPLVFGEPRYRLPSLQLLVRQAAVRPLVVSYAVHETQPLVFIRYFSLMS